MSESLQINNNNNFGLNQAIQNRDDEFYTRYIDIETHILKYKTELKDKVVYCNCDDYRWSNFVKFFRDYFSELNLKKVIATHYAPSDLLQVNVAYKWEYNGEEEIVSELKYDGSYSSTESLEILRESDVVITNPPYSKMRDYISLLMEHKKDFIIIAPVTTFAYSELFRFFVDGKIRSSERLKTDSFIVVKKLPGKKYKTDEFGNYLIHMGNSRWLTTFEPRVKRYVKPVKKYIPELYPEYIDGSGINVDYADDMPVDYDGIMGVPITYIERYNPNEFEILYVNHSPKIMKDGKEIKKFKRIMIRRKS